MLAQLDLLNEACNLRQSAALASAAQTNRPLLLHCSLRRWLTPAPLLQLPRTLRAPTQPWCATGRRFAPCLRRSERWRAVPAPRLRRLRCEPQRRLRCCLWSVRLGAQRSVATVVQAPRLQTPMPCMPLQFLHCDKHRALVPPVKT